jgi:hypothetical protein
MRKATLFQALCAMLFLVPSSLGQDFQATRLIFPAMADGPGWYSKVEIYNLDAQRASDVSFTFWAGNGGTQEGTTISGAGQQLALATDKGPSPLSVFLPADGEAEVTTRGLTNPLILGWVEARADVRIGGVLTYGHPFGKTTVLPSPIQRSHTLSIAFKRTGERIEYSTALGFVNPNEQSSYVDLTLVDGNGQTVNAIPRRVMIAPNGNLGRYIHEDPLFADLFAGSGSMEFTGKMKVVAERNIGVVTFDFHWLPDGTFQFHFIPPLAPTYKDVGEVRMNSILPVVFYPSDVPRDPDCIAAMRFVAPEVMNFLDDEFVRAGYAPLSSRISWVTDPSGQIKVDEFVSEYPASRFGWTAYEAELDRRYGQYYYYEGRQFRPFLLVMQHFNDTDSFAGAHATFSRPDTRAGTRCGHVSAEYLRDPDDFPTPTRSFTRFQRVTRLVRTAAHELVHSLGVGPHDDSLTDGRPGQFVNLMSDRGSTMSVYNGIGVFIGTLMPDIRPYTIRPINEALTTKELERILAFLDWRESELTVAR